MKKFVSRILGIQLVLLSAIGALNAASAAPRLVLHTSKGDLVAELYPDLAPKTVAQISKLVKAGLYDSTPFFRLERNFVLQTATIQNRALPLTSTELALIQKIPAEFSNIKHERGTLSLARNDDDLNSGESSFSILLSDAQHLDGKYTVFGKLVEGWKTLESIESMPRDTSNQPESRIEILKAEIVNAPAKSPVRKVPANKS